MCLMSLSLALVVLGLQFDSSYGVLLAVQKYTNIDYVFEVNASLQFNFSESGFIQGTAQLPCQPPTKCVEFYPGKKSFLIKGGTQENYSAVILTPEDSQLAHIAIVVVNKNEFFPELPGANCIKPFISDPFYSPPISVVLDKSIGDVRLLGNISRYEPGSVNKSLQIILPYERINGEDYKLMHVTGRMENESLSFSLAGSAGYGEVYQFSPYDNAPILMYPTHFLKWPQSCRSSGALNHIKWSVSLAVLMTLNVLMSGN